MDEKIQINFSDSTSVTIDSDTFLTCIANDVDSIKESNIFYSKIVYQNFLLNESNSTYSAQTSSILVGVMGLFASCDYFTLSENIDIPGTTVYKTSAIKSVTLVK